MTVTPPDELRADLELATAAGGFASVDEYVASLVNDADDEADLAPPSAPAFRTRAELEALIEAGFNSGVAGTVDDAFWARLDARIASHAARQQGAAR